VGNGRLPLERPITPRRTTTRRHHTRPDTWGRAQILVALRDWSEEVGLPPRSYEWCPASARSAGLIGPEDSKWEREHPRWPGNTTVYRHFDSWAAALEAAGIRPIWPARPPGTVAERVAAARRLERDGLGVPAIADALEVRPDTVRRYLKARPCRSCGDPVVGDARLCQACATRRANPKRWTPEEVIAAVHSWISLEGRPPTTADWRPVRFGGSPRWEEEFGDWPPSSVGRIVFGGWGLMLKASGVGANKPSWEPAMILAALRAYEEEFGRPPAKQDLEWPQAGYPSARTVRRHFGSFTGGLRAAGLRPRGARRWDTEAILAAIREFRREVDRWPRPSDWQTACEDWPSAHTVYNRLGSWETAVARAAGGLDGTIPE
jgi:hypothetical protein